MMGKSNFMVFSQRNLSAPGAKSIQNHRVQTTFFLQNDFFFQRTGNNCSSFTKLHLFFAYLDVALVFRYLCVFETGVTPKFQTESKQTSPMIDHGMGMGNTFGSQLRHCIFMMFFFFYVF